MSMVESGNMSISIKRYRLALWRMLVELATWLPVLVLVQVFALERSLFVMLALLAGASLCGYIIGRFRMKIFVEWLLSMGISLIAVYLIYRVDLLSALLMFIGIAVLIARWIRIRKGDWDQLFPASVQLIGLGLYLIYPLFVKAFPALHQWNSFMYGATLFMIVVFLFRLNGFQLNRANLNRSNQQGVPSVVTKVNKIAVAAVIAVLIGAANIGLLKRLLLKLWDLLAAWLSTLTGTEELVEETPIESQQPDMSQMFPGEIREQSALWKLIEQVFMYVVTALIIGGIIVGVGWLIIKVVVPAVRRWLSDLNMQRQDQGEFIDETEKMDSNDWRKRMKLAMSRLTKRTEQEPEDMEGRIRFRYKRMLQEAEKDGYQHKPSLTPIEAGMKLDGIGWQKRPVSLVTRLYNRVRYGAGVVSEAELEELDRGWLKVKK
jgi:hypothetical protein